MSLTARDLLQKIARDTGLPYKHVARSINEAMNEGKGLLQAVQALAKKHSLDAGNYQIDALKTIKEIEKILKEDYTQTLMISAVLGQMVEAKGKDRFPAPAFFAFLEVLSAIPQAPRDAKSETSTEIEELTTQIIELTTTLVSVICEWSQEGVIGVAKDCPPDLKELARLVFRKTMMLQSGLWACISCGRIVDVKSTRALMCEECDIKMTDDTVNLGDSSRQTRDRTGFGQTRKSEELS
ncbi:MAG: hypothetical protein ACFFFC_05705 [Candidatus Thorarchaeota archaeon]